MLRYLIPICVMLLSVNAFAPAAPQIASFRPASCIAAAKPPRALTNTAFVLRMSSENGEKEVSKISEDGTFYDDEVSSTGWLRGCSVKDIVFVSYSSSLALLFLPSKAGFGAQKIWYFG